MSRPRVAAAVAALALALTGCGSESAPEAKAPARHPRVTLRVRYDGRRGRRGADHAEARQADPAAQGREASGAAAREALHALTTQRRRQRRLPLLPARPEAHARHRDHRLRHPAGQPRRGAPRDPVPGAAGQGRPGQEEGRRDPGRRLDLLRQLGHRRARPRTRRRALGGCLGARRGRAALRQGPRHPVGQGLADRRADPLQPARGPRARPELGGAARDLARTPRDHAAHDAASGAGRAAVPPGSRLLTTLRPCCRRRGRDPALRCRRQHGGLPAPAVRADRRRQRAAL